MEPERTRTLTGNSGDVKSYSKGKQDKKSDLTTEKSWVTLARARTVL